MRSYFQEAAGDERYFIPILQRTVGDLETIVTANEKEATILENTLIKQHQPRYNVKLRDDKDFLCLRLDAAARVAPARACVRRAGRRRPTPDGARYFGPYHSATAARRTLHLVNKHFQLRTCADAELAPPQAAVPAVPNQALPGAVRPRGRPRLVRRAGRSGGAIPRRAARRAVGRAPTTDEGRRAARCASSSRPSTATSSAPSRRCARSSASSPIDDVDRDVVGIYREGEPRRGRAPVRARRASWTTSGRSRSSRPRSPTRRSLSAFLAQHYGARTARQGEARTDSLVPTKIILPPSEPEALGRDRGVARRARRAQGRCSCRRSAARGSICSRSRRDNATHAFEEKRRQTDDIEARLDAAPGAPAAPDPATPHRVLRHLSPRAAATRSAPSSR